MTKRKMKITFTKEESWAIYRLFSDLLWGNEKLCEAVGIDKTKIDFYYDIFTKFLICTEKTYPPEVDPIYEMTGGYLGDGVWITPDGELYEN